ncbi:MAG: 50S ribosomal protein L4 [Chloroflexi bacterium]|nr:50S ribosomal protein L4 [Chloroflexota bacterium]
MQVSVYDVRGEIVEQIDVSEDVFAVPFNEAVVHQTIVRQLANRRQGNASTKTRGEVVGSTRKLYRQKHTGRARRGNAKSPLLRGGGVAFGPHPRCYRQSMPRKMRRLALKCVLSAKVREEDMRVIDGLHLEVPKTKEMVDILSALRAGSSALIITAESDPNVVKASHNLAGIKVLPARLVNVLDLLSHKTLIATVPAMRDMEQIWGRKIVRQGAPENSENFGGKSHASL